jgi:hypothetical protein
MGQTDFEFGWNEKPDYSTDDPPTYAQACIGMMVCPHCGRALICGDIPPTKQENNNMTIPRSSSNEGGSSGQRRKKGAGLRYLTADMLSTSHQLATIADARMQDDNFKPNAPQVVVVKLKFKGEFILWTLRQSNPNLDQLIDVFGDEEAAWKGREIELYIEEDDFDGKKWIRSEPVAVSSSKKKSSN